MSYIDKGECIMLFCGFFIRSLSLVGYQKFGKYLWKLTKFYDLHRVIYKVTRC